MSIKLLLQALLKFVLGLVSFFLLLFLPAGTLNYWNGWLLMGLLFVPMLLLGIFLWVKQPELLEKRLHTKEGEAAQKSVIAWSALMFIASFLSAGLDFRYQWTHIPRSIALIAAVVFLVAYALYVEVMRENAYLSRTVEVQENQRVIDTGLYGVVRHPMYFSVLLLFFSMPLVLQSWISLLCMLSLPIILAKRIQNEEEVLKNGLAGYGDYMQRVKFRLIPFVW
ncbi:MAG: isoprenylcysteine carboxylmethyltransferase family protein [Hydrogenoanaerobacterium sp.]